MFISILFRQKSFMDPFEETTFDVKVGASVINPSRKISGIEAKLSFKPDSLDYTRKSKFTETSLGDVSLVVPYSNSDEYCVFEGKSEVTETFKVKIILDKRTGLARMESIDKKISLSVNRNHVRLTKPRKSQQQSTEQNISSTTTSSSAAIAIATATTSSSTATTTSSSTATATATTTPSCSQQSVEESRLHNRIIIANRQTASAPTSPIAHEFSAMIDRKKRKKRLKRYQDSESEKSDADEIDDFGGVKPKVFF